MKGSRFAVIGMGKFGRGIASILAQRAAEVIAIDTSESKIDSIQDEVATAITLDATDIKALQAQNIQDSADQQSWSRAPDGVRPRWRGRARTCVRPLSAIVASPIFKTAIF